MYEKREILEIGALPSFLNTIKFSLVGMEAQNKKNYIHTMINIHKKQQIFFT